MLLDSEYNGTQSESGVLLSQHHLLAGSVPESPNLLFLTPGWKRSLLKSAQNGPTILVAHSFGGTVITALGKDTPNVVGLVYLSAFAPDQGESMKALVTAEPQPAVGAAIRPDAQGFLWLDRDGFVEYFAPDVVTELILTAAHATVHVI